MNPKLQQQTENYLQELENLEQEIKGNKTSFLHSIKEVIEKSIEKKLSFTKISLLIQKHFRKKISGSMIREFSKKYLGYQPKMKRADRLASEKARKQAEQDAQRKAWEKMERQF